MELVPDDYKVPDAPLPDQDEDEEESPLESLLEKLQGGDADDDTPLVIAVIIIDWMHTHKTTNTATRDVWNALQAILVQSGLDITLPTWNAMHTLIKRHTKSVMEVI